MAELTKEQLIEEAKLKIAIAKCHPNSGVARVEGELFKIALTSLEAEPLVPVMYKGMKLLTKEGLELIRDGIAEATGLEAMCMADALLSGAPVPVVPEGLVKAVRFYEQVKRENPPVETGAWKDAVDWVLKEACQAVNIGIKGE
ncbi:YcgB [Escherichia coli TA280]|nr:YcgB [Escherichia coli TA280]